jgi:peptide/nickel transport system ATP-binding protein
MSTSLRMIDTDVASPVLEIAGLTVRLPKLGIREFGVSNVSLTVHAGTTRCLVGESGSGKSLTAQSILRLLPPHFFRPEGSIYFEGQNLLALSPAEMRRVRGNRIGMIFQEPMTALNPLLRVGRQIDEVLRVHTDLTSGERRNRVASILSEVNLAPEAVADRYPHQLSGGQRQRVMIAMALVLEPRLLIADEPTTALDVTTQAQILRLIKNLQERHGTGVLFITHDFGVVADIADTVTVMRDARVVEEGSSAKVLGAPEHPYTKALLDAVPRGNIQAESNGRLGQRPLALRVDQISKGYRQSGLIMRRQQTVQALNGVSFEIAQGEILGIVGESGSGKSTAARCVARLIEPDAGQIELDGKVFTSLRGEALRSARRNLQFVFQDPYGSMNPRRKVGRTIGQGLINYGMTPDAALDRARDLLTLVGLERAAADRYPSEFSGGQRQRISLARALALEPKVLIADEAVSALDVSVQAQVLTLLLEIRERLNLSILFITHDLRVAAELCDRILVMRHGVIVEQGSCRDVLYEPKHEYTKALIDSIPGRRLGAISRKNPK